MFQELKKIKADPLNYMRGLAEAEAPLVPVKIGLTPTYLLNDPEAIARVFRHRKDIYVKSAYYERLKPFIGQSLFTSEGEEWRRQRSNSQPAFRGPEIIRMMQAMQGTIKEALETLDDVANAGKPFGLPRFFSRLTLDIALRSVFGMYLSDTEKNTIFDSLDDILGTMEKRLWSFVPVPLWIPTKENRLFKAAVQRIRAILLREVQARWADTPDEPTFLDTIIAAERDQQVSKDTAQTLVVDQCMAMILASHETTSTSLSWSFYTLASQPNIRESIREEGERLLAKKGEITLQDMMDMPVTQKLFKEVLRLYPPAWSYSRTVLEDDVICGIPIKKGSNVILCTYSMHRHPRFWKNPDMFDLSRFEEKAEQARHPFAYFPFAGGRNMCLGNRFATLEGVMAIAMITARFDIKPMPDKAVRAKPATTLRPNFNFKATVKKAAPRKKQNLAA